MSEQSISVPAGIMHWNGTKCIPDTRKGTLKIVNEFDLSQVSWTPENEGDKDEWIVVKDAYLKAIDSEKGRAGRCYALKYTSSDLVKVFWLQTPIGNDDEALIARCNTLLDCPEEDRLIRENQTSKA
eukprot:GDKJ01004353.1.p1 GENE.GDKJ01004353.1~~GDKJ01004353.1.p1  ORF type:complete len:127 (-),score=28.09 GDKJ01004353.1:32-412(-)